MVSVRDPSFRAVLHAAARLQERLPDAVLVGGAAAALRAHHRVSLDADHVIVDLRERFDAILAALEETKGWVTSRVRQPVLILGSLEGVETGIRQLIRRRPLEVEEVRIGKRGLRVPTLEEIFRVKAWLVLRRNATRDYLDVVALGRQLGEAAAADVALAIDEYYEDQIGPGGSRVATQLAKQFAEPAPYDLSDVDLDRYRKLVDPWRDWHAVVAELRALSAAMLDRLG